MLIEVSNLKVNNKAATGTVKVVAPFPSLTWEYGLINLVDVSDVSVGVIDGIYHADPKGFAIKLGTSVTNLGTDLFNGNLTNTGFVQNKTTQWRYRGSTLTRGSIYYGQVRITDSYNNTSAWETFQLQYNGLPSITDASISPPSPTQHDDLVLSYDFSDGDGDTEDTSQTKIWWFRNGVHERQHDNKTIINSEFINFYDVWSAQIFPHDGYEYGKSFLTEAIEIAAETPEADGTVIGPRFPTYNDPLIARYTFSSPDAKTDKSVFRWYINDVLVDDKSTAFVRLELNEDDVVYYEMQPFDGDVTGDWVSSESVTILKPPYVVQNLRCNADSEPLGTSLTPSLSWDVFGPREVHTKVRVIVGTAPGANNIYDSGDVDSSQYTYVIPESILEIGSDYYVSVAVGDDGLGEYTAIHVRTAGSRWQEDVDNSTGWTIETTFKVVSTAFSTPISSSSSSSSSGTSETYQGVRIYDGTKYAEVRVYTDRILLTGYSKEYKTTSEEYAIYTIVGQGSNIKVYKN